MVNMMVFSIDTPLLQHLWESSYFCSSVISSAMARKPAMKVKKGAMKVQNVPAAKEG